MLVYCLPLFWAWRLGNGQLKQLQIIQNKAAQVVSPPRAERDPMYDTLQWLSVNQLVYYHSVLNVFKVRENKEPEHLAGLLGRDNRNNRIIVPNLDLSLAKKSFTLRAAENWNQMPPHIRTSPKIGEFKKLAKKWISEHIPRFLD